MFLFSCTAVAKKARDDVAAGEAMPFIVYIHYADLFGAEYLCKLYLMQAGFGEIKIDKRKQLSKAQIIEMAEVDADIKEAAKSGFCLRMFDSH
jgi:hypothetical protein